MHWRFRVSTSHLCKLHTGPFGFQASRDVTYHAQIPKRHKIRFSRSAEKLSTFSRWLWKQPLSVRLCTYISLHPIEAARIKNTFLNVFSAVNKLSSFSSFLNSLCRKSYMRQCLHFLFLSFFLCVWWKWSHDSFEMPLKKLLKSDSQTLWASCWIMELTSVSAVGALVMTAEMRAAACRETLERIRDYDQLGHDRDLLKSTPAELQHHM